MLIPLTENARRVQLLGMENFQTKAPDSIITILGYETNIEETSSKDLWQKMTKKIKKKIDHLSTRNLSFKGKILVAKTLLISKIWYLAYLLPPSRKQLNELSSIITKWIKNKSKMLPRYSIFQADEKLGGLRAPILKDLLDARLLSIWIKLLSENSFWTDTKREQVTIDLQNKRKITPKMALIGNNIKLKEWPER